MTQFSYDSIDQYLVVVQISVNLGDLSIICGNDAINRLADCIDNGDLLQIFAVNCRLQLLVETLVAASIVSQCRCPPGFLLTLHVVFLKGNNCCARVCRSSLGIGVVTGKMEDIPGVLWISLGTRNEFIGEPCASGRYTILIGLEESVGNVILTLGGLVKRQSRLVARFSSGHWGLQCITLGLELSQSCRVGVCDEIFCKSCLESGLTSGE